MRTKKESIMKNTKIALLVILVATALNISANNDGECDTCRKSKTRPVRNTVHRTGEFVGDTAKGAANILSFGAIKRKENEEQKDKNKKLKAQQEERE
jgi:hypothetical protein